MSGVGRRRKLRKVIDLTRLTACFLNGSGVTLTLKPVTVVLRGEPRRRGNWVMSLLLNPCLNLKKWQPKSLEKVYLIILILNPRRKFIILVILLLLVRLLRLARKLLRVKLMTVVMIARRQKTLLRVILLNPSRLFLTRRVFRVVPLVGWLLLTRRRWGQLR